MKNDVFAAGVERAYSAWSPTSLRSAKDGVGFGSRCRFLWLWSVTMASSTPRLWHSRILQNPGHGHTAARPEPYCEPTATPHHLFLPVSCCSRVSMARGDMPQPGACLRLHPLPRLCLYPNLGIHRVRQMQTLKIPGIRITNIWYLVPLREIGLHGMGGQNKQRSLFSDLSLGFSLLRLLAAVLFPCFLRTWQLN